MKYCPAGQKAVIFTGRFFWLLSLLLLLTACAPVSDGPITLQPNGAPAAASPGEAPAAAENVNPPALPPEEPEPPSETPEDAAEPRTPETPPVPEESPETLSPQTFVRAADYVPGLFTELRYAGENNFTGQTIYDFSEAYLRYGTAEKLARAQGTLLEKGYALLIWDAFRPPQAQFRLWEICPDPAYVANPEKGFSSHSRGSTVDLTLVTAEGFPVEMPTDFDDFSLRADRDYSDVSETAAANARLLEDAMTAAGFRPYSAEWWHYSDTDTYPMEESFLPPSSAQ